MNRKWWKLIYMLPITFCTLYAGGYVAQFIRNYQTWESAGNFAGNGTAPQIPSPHPLACLDALTAFPYNLYGIFLCLAAFGLLTFLLMRMGFDRNGEITDRGRNLNYSTKGTYGTSGFMTLEEMHQVLELTNDVKKHKGTILGKLNGKAVCLPKDTRMNRNIAVYGASGSMKSRAFARNMIFQCVARGESLIITDPKSELYESTATYLENAGYIVKSFNLVNPENSDSWNCLGEISGQETMAQVFADVIIQNTGSAKGDHFWDNAEMNLLILMDARGSLTLQMMTIESLHKKEPSEGNPDSRPAVNPKSWYSLIGKPLLMELVGDLQARGYEKLFINEQGDVYILNGTEPEVRGKLEHFPPKDYWGELTEIFTEDELTTEETGQALELSWIS